MAITLDEAKRQSKELEREIADLIIRFEYRTKMKIRGIEITERTGKRNLTNIFGVSLKITI